MTSTGLVWHYTVGPKLPPIAKSGALRSMDTQLLPREKPVLWFSAHPSWEPTATKPLFVSTTSGLGLYRPALRELHQRFGLYRFGLPAKDKRLYGWPHVAIAARIPVAMRLHLIDTGRDAGADPSDWFGSLASMPVAELSFEAFDGLQWRRSSLPAAAAAAASRFGDAPRIVAAVATL